MQVKQWQWFLSASCSILLSRLFNVVLPEQNSGLLGSRLQNQAAMTNGHWSEWSLQLSGFEAGMEELKKESHQKTSEIKIEQGIVQLTS